MTLFPATGKSRPALWAAGAFGVLAAVGGSYVAHAELQQARGGQPFRGRPKEHGRLRDPRLGPRAVPESPRERKHFAPALPHAYRGAEFAV